MEESVGSQSGNLENKMEKCLGPEFGYLEQIEECFGFLSLAEQKTK
jgi:hypothetical protein